MHQRWNGILLGTALFATGAMAQTTVTTSGGTTNTVPVFTGSATLGNSAITQSSGNVGIGTTTPGYALELGNNSVLRVDGPSSASGTALSIGGYGNFSIDAPGVGGGRFIVNNSGYVGINTASPILPLHVYGAANGPVSTGSIQNGMTFVGGYGGNGLFTGILLGSPYTAWMQSGYEIPSAGAWYPISLNPLGGNVGIGTTAPGAKLEVDGNVKLTSGSGASITFADGTVQSTAYTGVTCGGDYAETVDVAGSRSSYEPGDVMVLGRESGSDVTKSSEPYSTMVAGIYSTKPGVVGRRQTTDPKTSTTEIPMAMVGIVPTKVSAENGPIQRGDLLVSSSIPGYAMKGTDRSRMLGAVLGKAMGNLDAGTGVIEVLVTLQ